MEVCTAFYIILAALVVIVGSILYMKNRKVMVYYMTIAEIVNEVERYLKVIGIAILAVAAVVAVSFHILGNS